MEEEKWDELDGFPNYSVSDQGRVMNNRTHRIKVPSSNQAGVQYVNLSSGSRQHIKSVAVLVAEHFVDSDRPEHFDTPINLDGNRANNTAVNLAWRPRWFAIAYHKQFTGRHRRYIWCAVRDLETGELFEDSFQAVTKYGILEQDILLKNQNPSGTGIFPGNHKLELVY